VLVMALAALFNSGDIRSLAALAFFWFALSGLFNFALGRLLNAVSINLAGVARAAPLFSTAPVFATILGVTFLGESVTPWLVLGTLSVVAGIALITSEQAPR
ncbi:MAG: EamA family transporter, partial [Chloroflexi bacterium]|nr:EamA family transporter [Chloroflexota bacterium]